MAEMELVSDARHRTRIVAAVGEWEVRWDDHSYAYLSCTVPDGCTDTLRAIVKEPDLETEGVEYRMYRTVADKFPVGFLLCQEEMGKSWGLDSATGELKCEGVAIPPSVTHAYNATLEMYDRSDDWRDVVVELCWRCTTDRDYYVDIPDWIASLSPEAGTALVRFLDDSLTDLDRADRAEGALKLIGVEVTELLRSVEKNRNASPLAELLLIKGTRRTARNVVEVLESIGRTLALNTDWRFPVDPVFSSPEALDYLKEAGLVEKGQA